MSTYIYKAKKGPGEVIDGEIVAESKNDAVARIEGMGLVAISIAEKRLVSAGQGSSEIVEAIGKGALQKERSEERKSAQGISSSVRIKASDVDTFTYQLSCLVRASVSMLKGLSLLAQTTANKTFKHVINDIEMEVKGGSTLSAAMGKYQNIFDNLYLSAIRSGEKGGSLDEALRRLTEYREREREIRQKIQGALAYPVLLLLVGIGTIFVMLTYFLPKLMTLFENMKQTLPLPTKILMAASSFMSANWYWIVICAACGAFILARPKPGSKKKFLYDVLLLKMPFINRFISDGEISRFSRTLSLLLKNGISVHEALELATNTFNNAVLHDRLRGLSREVIERGSTLSGSLKETGVFPQFVINMIAVGEEAGRLDESLNEIAAVYEREIEQKVKIFTSLLEPMLILVIGGVVGFIVFAMLLPIFNMGLSPQ